MIENQSEESIAALVKRVLFGPRAPCQCEEPCSSGEDERRLCTREELERFYTDAQAIYTLLRVHDDYITHSISMSQCPLCREIELRTVEVNNLCGSTKSNIEIHAANVCPLCCRVIKIKKMIPDSPPWVSSNIN
ncbi:hypothetical protein MNBD_GAMMA16-1026 [hydrothermal vent metagenome]|uniref:Uncharacterized protein n=1 Tax=hydrothermal vent metagenome TaxID=652676 RepID=A0A3B0ZNA3_9ZZZZ